PPWYEAIDRQFKHVPWEGFVFYDLIFPLFLFVVGAVLPFSLGKVRGHGGFNSVHARICRRTLLLFALGLLYSHVLDLNAETFRISGVLQRIAICYGVTALVVVHTGVRVQAMLLAALLLGYWALLAFVPVPDGQAGDYSMQGS